MWLVYTFISMFITCINDLVEKKCINKDDEKSVPVFMVWLGVFSLLTVALIYVFDLNETKADPFSIIIQNPGVILSAIASFCTFLFFAFGYKYFNVSYNSTFANQDSLFFIILMFIYYVFTGNRKFINDLLKIKTIIGLVLIIIPTYILSLIATKQSWRVDNNKISKDVFIKGLIVCGVAAFFDGADSFISSVVIGNNYSDSWDYILAYTSLECIFSFIIWLVLSIKYSRPFNILAKEYRLGAIPQILEVLGCIIYLFAVEQEPVFSAIIWTIYPVLTLVGGRIIYKEKFTIQQYILLICVIAGSSFMVSASI